MHVSVDILSSYKNLAMDVKLEMVTHKICTDEPTVLGEGEEGALNDERIFAPEAGREPPRRPVFSPLGCAGACGWKCAAKFELAPHRARLDAVHEPRGQRELLAPAHAARVHERCDLALLVLRARKVLSLIHI